MDVKEEDKSEESKKNHLTYYKSLTKLNSKSDFQGFNIDKELAWFDGIFPEHIDEFCESLYDLTQKYHN